MKTQDSTKNTHVFVAMSGGVDSAVVLHLMKQEYENVQGVSHKHWPDSKCCTTACIDTCRAQCQDLGVPYTTIDTMVHFTEEIVDSFVEEYQRGRTPNPCVLCNQKNRFGHMVTGALEQCIPQEMKQHTDNVQYKIATGHYAQVVYRENRYWLARGKDPEKDQSYMLYRLSQEQLSHCLFPLGSRVKSEVRELAEGLQLESAKKPDSQDICFVETNYREFIQDYTGTQEESGDFVTQDGTKLGPHKGIAHYSRGQRKGLGLGGGPWYVLDIRAKSKEVVLGSREELLKTTFTVSNWVWHHPDLPDVFECQVQVRYHGKILEAQVDKNNNTVTLSTPTPDLSPGQSAVLYWEDTVIGGGIIQEVL
jgi:tRNA-specific 2-thiouridylase